MKKFIGLTTTERKKQRNKDLKLWGGRGNFNCFLLSMLYYHAQYVSEKQKQKDINEKDDDDDD